MQDIPDTKGQLQKKLEELKAFMASSMYANYIKELKEVLANTETSILISAPNSLDAMIATATLYGKREVYMEQVTIFEEYLAGLEQKLGELP